MSQDPNRPLTPPGDPRTTPEADRPASGPPAAGDPGARFPQDEGLEGQAAQGSPESGLAYRSGGGAPQEADPGLADQAPGGPAERPAWGDETGGGTARSYPGDQHQRGLDAASPGMGAAGGGATEMAAEREADGQQSATTEEALLDHFRERWPSVQGAFVDDPKAAVEEADRLVSELIQEVEQRLTRQRQRIQSQWTGGQTDTEQLRQLIHGYRALLHRLLEKEF